MRSASVVCLCFVVSLGEAQDALASLGSAAAEDPPGSSTRMEMQSRTAPQARPKAALLTAKGAKREYAPCREHGRVWGHFPTLKIITKVKWNWSDQMMIRGSWHRTALDVTVPGDRPKVCLRRKMAKYSYNISVQVNGESHYFGNLSPEKVKIFFDQFMLDHRDGDMFGVFPHEIEFSEDGIPFEDENGEVCDI